MTGFGFVTDDGMSDGDMSNTQANKIRTDAGAQYDRIRNDPSLSLPGKQAKIAKAYLAAKTAMAQLQDQQTSASETNRQRLMMTAFGIPSDPASAMSYRDAADRVQQIDDPAVAMQMYNNADDTGDTLFAQAVARHAWDMTQDGNPLGAGDPRWAAILDAYGRTRPGAGRAIADLQSLKVSPLDLANAWQYLLPAPSEVGGFSDYQMQRLIDQNSGAA